MAQLLQGRTANVHGQKVRLWWESSSRLIAWAVPAGYYQQVKFSVLHRCARFLQTKKLWRIYRLCPAWDFADKFTVYMHRSQDIVRRVPAEF